MKKIFLALLISSLCYATFSLALDVGSEEYTVKDKDTLWDITGSKLEDHFLWPKVWEFNPQISNPDLIHPGQKIMIPSREQLSGEPVPEAVKEPSPQPEPVKEVKPEKAVVQKAPVVSVMPEKEKPKRALLDKDLFLSIGWLSDEYAPEGKIISAPMNRQLSGQQDIVYVKLNNDISPSAGKFFTVRDVKIVKHPVTGKVLGHQIRVTGVIEVIGADKNTPKAKVLKNFEEDIQTGDGLITYREMVLPVEPDVVRMPRTDGYIVESLYNTTISSEGNIVFLDKGENDGLKAGDVFSVFYGSPVERNISKIQVVSLQPSTSAAIIRESIEEVTIGAKWGQE